MILTFLLDRYMAEMNQYARYLSQSSVRSKVVIHRHTYTSYWVLYMDH